MVVAAVVVAVHVGHVMDGVRDEVAAARGEEGAGDQEGERDAPCEPAGEMGGRR